MSMVGIKAANVRTGLIYRGCSGGCGGWAVATCFGIVYRSGSGLSSEAIFLFFRGDGEPSCVETDASTGFCDANP
jgi:hypothetical protein